MRMAATTIALSRPDCDDVLCAVGHRVKDARQERLHACESSAQTSI